MLPWIGGIVLGAVVLFGTGCREESVAAAVSSVPAINPATDSPPTAKRMKAPNQLTPEQIYVTQHCGTEPPFRNAYWNNKEPGLYVCVVSGEPLFTSVDKFDSGTGWPSFTRPVRAEVIEEKEDLSHGMRRVEVRSAPGNSHLGHVFPDGPGPEGLRYCINSAALRFIPVADLEREGYGEWVAFFQKNAPPR